MRPGIPWIVIAVFVSLCLFYYYNQKARIRREDRRADRREKHQEYLDTLLITSKDEASDEQEPT